MLDEKLTILKDIATVVNYSYRQVSSVSEFREKILDYLKDKTRLEVEKELKNF